MNWTKIPTNLIIEHLSDKDIIAIVKYQLLWAALEHQPDDRTALCHMTAKQLRLAQQYYGSISSQVSTDIDSCNNHRSRNKSYYTKKQELTKKSDGHSDAQTDGHSDGQSDGIDKIRLDKNTPLYPPKGKSQTSKKQFVPPTLDEWMAFCKELKLKPERMRSVFLGYQSNNWRDSHGTQIKNWKMKIRQVWDKDENHDPDADIPDKPRAYPTE